MGLIHTATADNRIIDEGLVINYDMFPVKGYWEWNDLSLTHWFVTAWEYHRFATMKYRYVGMDRDSAYDKSREIIRSLNRYFYISKFANGEFSIFTGGKKIQGSVEVLKTVGHMYEIIVQINEHDVHLSRYPTADYNALFYLENAREYIF